MAEESENSSESGNSGNGGGSSSIGKGGWISGVIKAFTSIFVVTTNEVSETKIQEKNLGLRRYLIENQQLPLLNNLNQYNRTVFNPILIGVFVMVIVVLVMIFVKRAKANAKM